VADEPAIEQDYTVFVQLLNAENAVAAQSDSLPAGGARPTTGWRSGEVIVDAHRLPWKPGVPFEQGRLIFGMYGADGTRVTLADGADFGTLDATLENLENTANINP
jgi:hypothetical protein